MSDKKRNSKQKRLEFHRIRNVIINDEETGEKKIFICSNQMLLNTIKASLPDGKGESREKFIKYFSEEPKDDIDKFSSVTMESIYKRTYDVNKLKMFINMMDYVNKDPQTEQKDLSVETAGIRVDRELTTKELDKINHLINISQFNDQREKMDTKIKEIICNLSGTTEGEKFFHFKLEILKLYEKVYSESNKMALVNAIDGCYKPKEFNREKSKFLKKDPEDVTRENFTQDIILKIAVAYSYEMIKER